MKFNAEYDPLMDERFGHDSLIALAALDGDSPAVRSVNAFFEAGCFYTITYAVWGTSCCRKYPPEVAPPEGSLFS